MTKEFSPLNIEGFTGNIETMNEEYDAALRRWRAAHPDADPRGEEAKAEGMRLAALMDTVARYSTARERLAEEQYARFARDRALQRVESRWEELKSASAWLAAHHAYVCAVDEARHALDMWRESAEAALRKPFFCSSPRDEAAYRQIREAGHSGLTAAMDALDRAPVETGERMRCEMEKRNERRVELTRVTLSVANGAASPPSPQG